MISGEELINHQMFGFTPFYCSIATWVYCWKVAIKQCEN